MADPLAYVGQAVGDYRLQRLLGGGGFGNVYLAEQMRGGPRVAVKMLQICLTKQEDLQVFINEARIIRLRHPHIVPLLDFGLSSEGIPFLVMEYAPSGTLRDRHPKGSRVPLLTAIEYAAQVASALQYAHDHHLVHRDVKPENMLVRSDGVILLSDFGIAIVAHSTSSINDNQGMAGTVFYMAPEQLAGKPRAASDQYALAVVVYEWLVGKGPFQGTAIEIAMQHATQVPPSFVAQVPDVPKEVEAVLFKALAKDYKERFSSMQEFVAALQYASLSPTFRMSGPPRTIEPINEASPLPTLPHGPIQENPPPSTLPRGSFPLERDQLSILAPSVQPLARQSTKQKPEKAAMNERVPLPERKRGISKSVAALLLVLVVLLIVGGSYAYLALGNARTTAFVGAHQGATAKASVVVTKEAKASAVVTVDAQAASNAYRTAVAQHGIMLGFDAQHTHYNPYEVILNTANVSRLQQKWAALTGAAISTSPVVANGLVYIGSRDHQLYAFDALTGQQKWAAPTGAAIDSSPAAAYGMVYVGSWDYKLYAFDALTGQQKWTSPTGGPVISSPVIANGIVYVGGVDRKLYAFDAMTGQLRWTAPTGDVITSTPSEANGIVYTGAHDGKLYAFDAVTGQLRWVSPADQFISSSPAESGGTVYIGSQDHHLYAFDATTGQIKWISPPTSGRITSSPAVANGVIYVGCEDHQLHAFDAMTGQQKWVAPTGDIITSSPEVANGVVYVGSQDHQLYAFDATTGQMKWTSPPTGNTIFFSSPAVANGVVYIGSMDYKLYAFSLPVNAV